MNLIEICNEIKEKRDEKKECRYQIESDLSPRSKNQIRNVTSVEFYVFIDQPVNRSVMKLLLFYESNPLNVP